MIKKSNFRKTISGVSQCSITGPILFNFSINDLFFIVLSTSIYNFADDNSLSAIAKTIAEFKNILLSELEVVIYWLKNNKMIVNPEKFQAIILDKQKHDYSNETIESENLIIKQLRLCLLSGS